MIVQKMMYHQFASVQKCSYFIKFRSFRGLDSYRFDNIPRPHQIDSCLNVCQCNCITCYPTATIQIYKNVVVSHWLYTCTNNIHPVAALWHRWVLWIIYWMDPHECHLSFSQQQSKDVKVDSITNCTQSVSGCMALSVWWL